MGDAIFQSLASSSKGNCHIFRSGGHSIMLDCGLPAKEVIKRGVSLGSLSGVLVTHEHRDHCKGVPSFLDRAVDVYMPDDTRDSLVVKNHHRAHAVDLEQPFKVGEFDVIAFPVPHDVDCVGYLVRGRDGDILAYITDCAYCPYRLPAVTVIALEVNYSVDMRGSKVNHERKRRTILNHMSLPVALKMLRMVDTPKLKECHILHLSDANAEAKKILKAVKTVVGCEVFIADA